MDPGRVDVVLVRPSRAANVAAACRALKNMGLARSARRGPAARASTARSRGRSAYGAWDVLDAAGSRPTCGKRSAGEHAVGGTRRTRARAAARTPRRLARGAAALAGGRPDRPRLRPRGHAGCRTRSSRSATRASTSPPTPAHPSLNLAQAVLLVAYELRVAAIRGRRRAGEAPRRARDRGRAGVGPGRPARGAGGNRLPQSRQPGARSCPSCARFSSRGRADVARGHPAARPGPPDPLGGGPDCAGPGRETIIRGLRGTRRTA